MTTPQAAAVIRLPFVVGRPPAPRAPLPTHRERAFPAASCLEYNIIWTHIVPISSTANSK
jgi:hypothetical protein